MRLSVLIGAGAFSPIGIILVVVLTIAVSLAVNAIQNNKERAHREVLAWAATSALAAGLTNNNCRLSAAPNPLDTIGWWKCTYICKSAQSQHFVRYMPLEFGCPAPVPCAPGLYPTDTRIITRIMWRIPVLDAFSCRGLI